VLHRRSLCSLQRSELGPPSRRTHLRSGRLGLVGLRSTRRDGYLADRRRHTSHLFGPWTLLVQGRRAPLLIPECAQERVSRAIPRPVQDGRGDQARLGASPVGVTFVAIPDEQCEAGKAATQLQVDGKLGARGRRGGQVRLQGGKPPRERRRPEGRRLVVAPIVRVHHGSRVRAGQRAARK
jgi:hypothetical protein